MSFHEAFNLFDGFTNIDEPFVQDETFDLIAPIYDTVTVDKATVQPTDISRWSGTGNIIDAVIDNATTEPEQITPWAGSSIYFNDKMEEQATVQPDQFDTQYISVGAVAVASVVNDVIIDAPEAVLTGNSTTPIVYQTSTIDAPLQTAAFTPINNSESSSVLGDQIKPFYLSKSALIMAGFVVFVLLKNGVS